MRQHRGQTVHFTVATFKALGTLAAAAAILVHAARREVMEWRHRALVNLSLST